MPMFLIIFFSIYGAMHAVFYYRIRPLLPASIPAHAVMLAFLAFMVASPLISRYVELYGHDPAARLVGMIGYCWMGFIFLVFSGIVLFQVLSAVTRIIGRFGGPAFAWFSSGSATAVLIVAAAAACVYGVWEARQLRVEMLSIETVKLPLNPQRLRIVQISVVHLGLMTRPECIQKIVDSVQAEKPDILVCTGDLVDGSPDHINGLIEMFRRLEAPYGKFAVNGNHEFYRGLGISAEFFKQAGFDLLRGEVRTVRGVINIAGVDDHQIPGRIPEEKVLNSLPGNGLFNLFLKHRPEVDKLSRGRFDLQLSGHTHGGQIFPFNFIVAMAYPLMNGYQELEGGILYASRGTGTWGPPMRVLAPPEITVIDLVRPD